MYPETRRGRPGDAAAIARIERASFPDPWPPDVFEECLEPWSGISTWIAADAGRIIGYVCAAIPSPGVLHVANLCVTRSARRMGVGRLLLETAEDWGAASGCRACFLEVRCTNRAAVGLYIRKGYTPCGHLPGYYGPRRHGLRLVRGLEAGNPGKAALAGALAGRLGAAPPVGIVLGSGLSWVADLFGEGESISWEDLPGMSGDALPGHPGRIVTSSCGRFVFLLGRRHHYQGFSGNGITMLPESLADLGVSTWILTSSAGAVSRSLAVGDAVVFRDHVNLSGCVPDVRSRIPSPLYSMPLRRIAAEAAGRTGARVSEGLFACVSGPAYETVAELDLLRRMGVDAVSMSTAPEALALAARGCDVLGLAFVTNTCGPGEEVTHQAVLDAQGIIRSSLGPFLGALLGGAAAHALR
ncbi:MAG: GNAT family N-acetyltransferase [Candidatus Fermentibacter sp.]|nr:GNAT family N-acetyltransferase [Candidatus Fermentibacter sp.]